jgi:hypothetical protein
MSSQFLQAWLVDAATFSGVIGSKDKTLVKRACAASIAKELEQDVEDLAAAFASLVDGTLDRASWTARRLMTLVADAWGKRVDTGLTLPGRGWQFLGPAWKHWGLKATATLWTTEPAWAKKKPFAGEWPRIMWGKPEVAAAIVDETARFQPRIVVDKGVPSQVERFGEGEWPMEPLSEQIAAIAKELHQVAKAAVRAKKSLAIWLDGGQ